MSSGPALSLSSDLLEYQAAGLAILDTGGITEFSRETIDQRPADVILVA